MADFFKDNLGYELVDCICGERPEFVSMQWINTISHCPYLYFVVRCTKCGRIVGPCVDEEDAVFEWNQYMKKKE